MIIALSLALLICMILTGMPIAFALVATGVIGLLLVGGMPVALGILKTMPLSSVSSYEMISVPMFLLMAQFVVLSGIADDLFRAAATWVGRVRGGLGIATALAGAGFGAISGSSTASAATLSATTIPAMLKQGYERKLACGAVAISGTLAMLIPPSIALVLFGIIGDVSIGKLLIGGIVPGILVTITIALTIYLLVMLDPQRAPIGQAYSFKEKLRSLKVVWPMLLLFMSVTVVIYAGVATPTEASAIGAFGAFILAWRAGRINRRSLLSTLITSASASCMIFAIILGAHIFTVFITLTQATQQLIAYIAGLGLSPYVVLVAIVIGYVILGCFLDLLAIMVLTVPIVLPVVVALGFDPVWFGVLVIVVGEVGLVTPPVGLNVFVVARYAKRPVEEVFGGVWPHVLAHFIVIAILIVFPELVLWLPSRLQ